MHHHGLSGLRQDYAAEPHPAQSARQRGVWWVLVGFGGSWWVLVGYGGFWWVLVGSGGFGGFEGLRCWVGLRVWSGLYAIRVCAHGCARVFDLGGPLKEQGSLHMSS